MLDKDVDHLCAALNAEADPICNSDKKIYPSDFSDLIAEMFDSPRTRYQDVQHVFAQYQTKLDVSEGSDVFAAYYDINRDGNWDLWVSFDGTLEANVIRGGILFRESLD